MNSQARASVQLLVANVAFKMFCLLMLNEDLFIVEISITVPAPWLHLLLLFSPHFMKYWKTGIKTLNTCLIICLRTAC